MMMMIRQTILRYLIFVIQNTAQIIGNSILTQFRRFCTLANAAKLRSNLLQLAMEFFAIMIFANVAPSISCFSFNFDSIQLLFWAAKLTFLLILYCLLLKSSFALEQLLQSVKSCQLCVLFNSILKESSKSRHLMNNTSIPMKAFEFLCKYCDYLLYQSQNRKRKLNFRQCFMCTFRN